MTDIIDYTEIEIECKICGGKTKKSMKWVEDHEEFACECGTLIPVDAKKYRKESAKAESNLDGVQGLREKLGK